MKIEILTTPGCTNCNLLEKMLDHLNIKYSVIDVTESPEYLKKYPIFAAPGLIINDILVCTGIPKKNVLEKFLKKSQ